MIKVSNLEEIIKNIDDNSIIIVSPGEEAYYKKKLLDINQKVCTLKNFIINNYDGFSNIASSEEEFLIMYNAYLSCKDNLTKYNDINDLSFIKDLLSTYNSFYSYALISNDKINDLSIIYNLYENMLTKNGLINDRLLYKYVLENKVFDKNYIFLNINSLTDNEEKLLKNMSDNGNVTMSINEYDSSLINKINNIYPIDVKPKVSDESLNYYALNDIEEELLFISNDISKKIITDKCSYSDILIVTKDENLYEPYFNLIFDFPYHKKTYNGILTKRFINIFSDIINGNFSCSNFINLLKLDLFDVSLDTVDKLDNYIYEWNLEKESFYIPFKNGKDTKLIDLLNELRESVINEIMYFLENVIHESDFKVISREFWTYLGESKIDEKLFLNDASGYNKLVKISEDVSDYFNFNLGICKYFEIISFLCEKTCTNNDYVDEVFISNMDNLDFNDKKYVYLLGASSTYFPSAFSLKGLISMEDLKRDDLINKINDFSSYDKAIFDKLTNLFDVTITYHKLSTDLSLNEKSLYLNGKKIEPDDGIYSKRKVLDNYSSLLSNNKVFKIDLDEPLINKINDANNHDLNLRITNKNALKLYSNNIICSPSSIETYSKCKFYHFCQYGLRLKVKEKRLFDNREVGTIVHYILENIIKNDINKVEISNIYEYAKHYAFKYLEENDKLMDDVTKYVISSLCKSTSLIIKNIISEKDISSFEPKYVEFKIDNESIIKPICVPFNDNTITVKGVIDRVDVCEDNDRYYFRVIDYKTGGKKLRLDDCLEGLNLQMLLYVLAFKNGLSNITNKKPVISALLYYPALVKEEKAKRNLNDEELDLSIKKRLLMEGIINKDSTSIKMLGDDDMACYINVSSRGKINEEKTFGIEELELLFSNIKTTLAKIGEDMLNGDISINPVKGRCDACSFCKFSSICAFDSENDKARYLKNYKNSEVFKMLEGDKNA